MAISNNIYAGSETQFGIVGTPTAIGQAAWNSATAATVNAEVWEFSSMSVDWGITRHNQVKNDGSRVISDYNDYYTGAGGLRVITFSDMIVRRKDLGVLVYAVLQNVSEAAGTPFKKTYTLDNSTTQPLFSNDAGFFFTFGAKGPIASYHWRWADCIIRSLTLAPGDDGRLRASGEIISGTASGTALNFNTGTWSMNTSDFYNCYAPTKKQIVTASDVVLYDWSVTYNNHAVRLGNNSSGDAESLALATGPEGYEVTGTWTVKYDANVQDIIANCIAGTGVKLELDIGTDGAAGFFGQTYNEVALENVDRNYETEMGQQLVIPWRAMYDRSGTTALATIEVDDALDRTW